MWGRGRAGVYSTCFLVPSANGAWGCSSPLSLPGPSWVPSAGEHPEVHAQPCPSSAWGTSPGPGRAQHWLGTGLRQVPVFPGLPGDKVASAQEARPAAPGVEAAGGPGPPLRPGRSLLPFRPGGCSWARSRPSCPRSPLGSRVPGLRALAAVGSRPLSPGSSCSVLLAGGPGHGSREPTPASCCRAGSATDTRARGGHSLLTKERSQLSLRLPTPVSAGRCTQPATHAVGAP